MRRRPNSQAVAYSNRAVLRWLNADAQGARQDLAKAQALAPQATFVIRNMSAMQSHENASPRQHRESGEGGTGMTGVGDGAALSIPLERLPRLLSVSPTGSRGPRDGLAH